MTNSDSAVREILGPADTFVRRHVGPSESEVRAMLAAIGCDSLEQLVAETIPAQIRLGRELALDAPRGEYETLAELRAIAEQNVLTRSLIGMGYYETITPPVVQRCILENPGWYTQYTPYQAEIAQGRLEALTNFQTMIADLTALPMANASLLDEATAAAEAMHLCRAVCDDERRRALVIAPDCHPQTIAVTPRATPIGVDVRIADPDQADLADAFAVMLQYPATDGRVFDYAQVVERAHAAGALVIVATDLLALTLLKPPGEFGADVALGSAQRFGVPLGGGGPHAAFMACRDEFKRHLPGRIIGVSRDVHGKPAYRLAIQTREQHIRREKATSNICTAQVLLAVMASMYGVYHGPRGLRRIAERVQAHTAVLAAALRRLGHAVLHEHFFDTLRIRLQAGKASAAQVRERAEQRRLNFRYFPDGTIGVALSETVDVALLEQIVACLGDGRAAALEPTALLAATTAAAPAAAQRQTAFMTHPVFNCFHSEHEMLRYIKKLESRDLSLTTSMISLGSCTMKLNATAEMFPVSWPHFAQMHPFAPADQQRGYQRLFDTLSQWLAEITGFAAVSLQPNAGSQGEYAGLLAIRGYHESRGHAQRNVCLIPLSAHGTNPASAVMAGFEVVTVKCDERGNVDLADLRARADEHRERLGALMLTYPSTHGVFEEAVRDICASVHDRGGQVYMDGANMNAQVGLCRPGDIGADVCHLNLHKTFCIPHGGGGPGMGPIAVAAHLAPFLPGHPLASEPGAVGPVSAAPFGSPSILPISWMYIRMMGAAGLRRATEVAILNANYMAGRLEGSYPVLYRGAHGRCAHEFILDLRPFESSAGVKAEDVASCLIDYGFHAPTMSFPVPGTLMIEPTESESRDELDRFCDAMIAIREEIRAIESGRADRRDNPLKNAPHTAAAVTASEWTHAYSREEAAYPAAWVREHKFWPAVGRVDNVWGDRNLFCTCPPMEALAGRA